MSNVRIGEVLVRRGTLTRAQADAVLEAQSRGHRPFGELAENMYGIDPTDIEQAWIEQYAGLTRHIDPDKEEIDPRALKSVDRRQAWQFRVFPVRFDGRELMLATTRENLCRALRFATRCIPLPCYLVLSDAVALGAALERYYPLPGMNKSSMQGGALDAVALLSGP